MLRHQGGANSENPRRLSTPVIFSGIHLPYSLLYYIRYRFILPPILLVFAAACIHRIQSTPPALFIFIFTTLPSSDVSLSLAIFQSDQEASNSFQLRILTYVIFLVNLFQCCCMHYLRAFNRRFAPINVSIFRRHALNSPRRLAVALSKGYIEHRILHFRI